MSVGMSRTCQTLIRAYVLTNMSKNGKVQFQAQIAMHYFATGTSFHQVQCMHLKKRLPSSCCIPMTIYCPAKKQLASTLIEKCHQELQSKVNVHMKVATSCLTSNVQSNIKNDSIMNYMAVSMDCYLFLEFV